MERLVSRGDDRVPQQSAMQLRVSLLEIRSSICRRLLVPGTTTPYLPRPGKTCGEGTVRLAPACLWYHRRSQRDVGSRPFRRFPSQSRQRSREAALTHESRDRSVYQCDFGDDWKYLIELEEILRIHVGLRHAVRLDGARACSPEDVSSTPGDADPLDAVADRRHE